VAFALDDYADGFCSGDGRFWGARVGVGVGVGVGWCGVDCGWKWDVPLTTEIDAAVGFAASADEVHVFVEEGIGDYVSAIAGGISFAVNGKGRAGEDKLVYCPPVDCARTVEACRLCVGFEAGEVMVVLVFGISQVGELGVGGGAGGGIAGGFYYYSA